MTRLVVLDSGPLGLLILPPEHPASGPCERWFATLVAAGVGFAVPEVVDYELRRELLRMGSLRGVRRLNEFVDDPGVNYLPISAHAMRLAAQLWAETRRAGRPTADRHALDADVILAAKVRLLANAGRDVIVATTNVAHLIRFVPAAERATIAA